MPARLLPIVLVACGLAVPLYQSKAQQLECGADDRQCLQDAFEQACGRPQTLEGPCLAWLRSVEEHPLAPSPEWRLIAAAGYRLVARYAASEDDTERYIEQSRSIYLQLLARWRDGPYAAQAYVGMAGLTDDIDELISLVRNAVQADPSNANTRFGLAQSLRTRGRAADYAEAADLYREAYEADAPPKYYSAANALRLYMMTGRTAQAETFRGQIARDTSMADFAEEVISPRFAQNLEHAEVVLDTACATYIIDIFGPATCANGIDTLVTATRQTASIPARQSIADLAAGAMGRLNASGVGSPEEQSQRDYKFGSILRGWIDTGVATARVFVQWAHNPGSDLNESVSAFERAVELAPDNGQYRYWLALGYMEQGRFDEAIEGLRIARETLPENVGLSPESVDAQIRRAQSGRTSRE